MDVINFNFVLHCNVESTFKSSDVIITSLMTSFLFFFVFAPFFVSEYSKV